MFHDMENPIFFIHASINGHLRQDLLCGLLTNTRTDPGFLVAQQIIVECILVMLNMR